MRLNINWVGFHSQQSHNNLPMGCEWLLKTYNHVDSGTYSKGMSTPENKKDLNHSEEVHT